VSPLVGSPNSGSNGRASGSKRPGRKSNAKRRPASEYLGLTTLGSGSSSSSSSRDGGLGASAAAAAGAEWEWDEEQGLADSVELEAGFSPWHKQSIQVGKPLVKGSAEAAQVQHMLQEEVGPALPHRADGFGNLLYVHRTPGCCGYSLESWMLTPGLLAGSAPMTCHAVPCCAAGGS
jgi:hypothetical protein